MNAETRKSGRPAKELHTRQRLIDCSRELFTALRYEKVSTRLISQKAGVNSSMIRYYFRNKQGLFEAMVRDTLQPAFQKQKVVLEDSTQYSLIELMRAYYVEMIKIPNFPKLMISAMLLPPDEAPHQVMKKVIWEFSEKMREVAFEKWHKAGTLQEGMSPSLCRITYLSLMMFPFIIPHKAFSMHGFEKSEEFLLELFEHNLEVMKHGFLAEGCEKS